MDSSAIGTPVERATRFTMLVHLPRMDGHGLEPRVHNGLTDVDFLNSAGLTALLDATWHADARPEPLRIVVDANRPVIRPIEVTGLDDVLALYHSVEEALNARQRP